MEIKLQPLDTLFFRDGKPFEKGENTWADGMMLPTPTVIYGALRTAFAIGNKIDFKDIFIEKDEENGKKLCPKEFSIERIYYYVKDTETLPLPLDYVEHHKSRYEKYREDDNKKYEVQLLEVNQLSENVINSKGKTNNTFLLPKNKEQVDEFENGLLDVNLFEAYLANELRTTEALKLSDFIIQEPKIGIGRENDTKVSEDGNLFRVDMQRSKDFQIGVALKSDYPKFSDLIKLGGENKVAKLVPDEDTLFGVYRTITFEKNRFKIYFSTPAILLKGEPDLSKLELSTTPKLVTSIVGKPIFIGGFNMKAKRPKKMYRVIPAGSVFYYETDEDVSSLNKKQGISLSDKLSEQGFGICYFGTWNINE